MKAPAQTAWRLLVTEAMVRFPGVRSTLLVVVSCGVATIAALPSAARAESGPAPPPCLDTPGLRPHHGDIPANLPAFAVTSRPGVVLPPVADHAFRLNEDATGDEVPLSLVTSATAAPHLLRLTRILRPGAHSLTWVNHCLSSMPRRETRGYRVIPAVATPTTIGQATLRPPKVFPLGDGSRCGGVANAVGVGVDVALTPEMAAYSNAATFTFSIAGRQRVVEPLDPSATVTAIAEARCDRPAGEPSYQPFAYLPHGRHQLTLRAQIPGMETSPAPLVVDVELSCPAGSSNPNPPDCPDGSAGDRPPNPPRDDAGAPAPTTSDAAPLSPADGAAPSPPPDRTLDAGRGGGAAPTNPGGCQIAPANISLPAGGTSVLLISTVLFSRYSWRRRRRRPI